VSRKGQLQGIALSDVSTLMPVYGQDRGSLLPPYRPEHDLSRIVPRELDAARDRRRITPGGHAALGAAVLASRTPLL
jgi:S-DNA-T family DNA segregation ATPase FtsK/SpoIIIE